MFKKTTTTLLAATLLTFGATACGGDDDTDAKASTEADSGDSGDSGDSADSADSGSSSDNADVQAYCDQAAKVADELKKVMADPTSGDMAALSTEATELVAKAAQLSSANADDVDEINRCSALLSEAVGG